MLYSGLVSATFRNKTTDEVIEFAKKVGLDAIEWSSDFHVMPGDVETARRVGEKTRAAGLKTPSYASYYRHCMHTENFEEILESAIALGAGNIRVWAGEKPSAEMSETDKQALYDDINRICDMADEKGITVSLEFHDNSFTDTPETTNEILKNCPKVYTYWQTWNNTNTDEDIRWLRAVAHRLKNVHVHYRDAAGAFLTMAEGKEQWKCYTDELKAIGGDRFLFVEFVKDRRDEQFEEDVCILKELIK